MAIYFGTPYDDYLYGWAGNDTLIGGAGNDTLYGGFIFSPSGGDKYLDGGDGNDSLFGWTGNDTLLGGAGNDFLNSKSSFSFIGDGGNDYLYGGAGNDTLLGGLGNDTLLGGEGSDRFVYTSSTTFSPVNFGVDVISDFVSGTDQIHLQRAIFPSISSVGGTGFSVAEEFATVTSDADAATSTADIVYNSVNGNLFYNSNGSDPGFGTGDLFATLTGAPPLVATDFIMVDGNDTLNGGTGNETFYGGAGNDYLNGGAGDDYLNGGDGNDTLYGWSGDDYLNGGDGNDRLYGEDGNDWLNGGAGNDSLIGEAGNDSLIGEAGDDYLDGGVDDDYLDGGVGNDTLIAGVGNDTLMGGEGSDRFVYTSSTTFSPVNFGVDVISDFVSGTDQIHLQRAIFPSISSVGGTGFSVAGEFAIVECDAEAATSTADIVYNSVNGNLFYNSNGSDPGFGTGDLFATLTGAPPLVATDFVIEDGDDYVTGGAGDDTIDGGAGNDDINGGDGNNYLDGGAENDWLFGGAGNDELNGGTGNDELNGGAGDDTIDGGAGNDWLIGGLGNDTLMGGVGRDSFLFFDWVGTSFNSVTFGVDVIPDFETGTDVINLKQAAFSSLSSSPGIGFSVASEFAIVTSDDDAATSIADIVYNSVNGNLFYNPNGSSPGFGTGALFATLTGAPTLVATDFYIMSSPDYGD